MPTCITVNSNVDFTVTALSAPQDGYTIAIAQATPSPTATAAPTPTPSPSPTIGYNIFAWGQNSGNFGNDTVANSSSPILISSLDYIDLYNNYGSSWFQKTDGTMWVWGKNNFGQLGLDLGTAIVSSPVQLGTQTNVWNTFIIGNNLAAGTKTDGTLWTWGNNARGSLGINSAINASSPAQVGTDTNWASAFVGIGNSNMFAIKKDGSLWASGRTDHILGNLYGAADVSSPIQVGNDTNWTWVYVTQYGNLLQKNDGTYWGLGSQPTGQFGQNNIIPYSSPVQIGAGYSWDSMTASNQHIAAIRSCDKSLWVCGGNPSGQLGQNNNIGTSLFVQVGTDTTWAKAIACLQGVAGFTIGLKTDGTVWAFGGNSYGYLGQNNITKYSSPVQVGTGNWLDISAGISTVFALKSQSAVPLPTIGVTLTPCATLAPTGTPSPSATPANTPFPTASATPVPTASPTGTPVPTASTTPLPTPSNTPVPTASATPVPTASPTGTPVPTASATPVPTASPTGTPVPTASTTPVPTASVTPVPTSTPAPSASATPVPTASATPVPTSTPAPSASATPVPPTPSPSGGGGGATPITGGNCCDTFCGPGSIPAVSWPAYGSSNKYAITIANSTDEQWFNMTTPSSRTIFMTTTGSVRYVSDDSDPNFDPPCSALSTGTNKTQAQWAAGVTLPTNQTGNFAIVGFGGGVTGTFDIWIV